MLFKSAHQVILDWNDQIKSDKSSCLQHFRCSMRPFASVSGQFSVSRTLAVRYQMQILFFSKKFKNDSKSQICKQAESPVT